MENKKIINIWVDKSDNRDWMKYAHKIDCRNRKGYSLIGYIGYNIRVEGIYTYFDCNTAWLQTITSKVLTINIDSIEESVKNVK